MPREQLLGLATDVSRLLSSGVNAAVGSDGLRKRGQKLRELGRQVPALNPVADAVDRLVQSTSKQAAPALLDLLVMAGQIRASLSAPGLAGDLEALPPSGPWQTPLPIRDVRAVERALTVGGEGSEKTLRDAVERKALGDLRLVSALLHKLENGSGAQADKVIKEALPLVGPAVLPDLTAQFNPNGDAVDARRLEAICLIDPAAGATLCRQVLNESSPPVRVQALECLPDVVKPAEAEKAGLPLCDDKNKDVRLAALSCLRTSKSDAALERLLSALSEYKVDRDVERIIDALAVLPHPRTVERLKHALDQTFKEEKEGRAAVAALKKSRKKAPKPAAKKGAKAPKTPLQEAEERLAESRALLPRLIPALGRRKGEDVKDAVDALLPLVRHAEDYLRLAAVQALGEAGAVTKGVIPTLMEALSDNNPYARSQAGSILVDLPVAQREAHLPAFLKYVQDPKQPGRDFIITCLPDHAERHPQEILGTLRKALQDKDDSVCDAAAHALRRIGPPARDALNDLFAYLDKGKCPQFTYSSSFFAHIDPDGTTVIPKLIKSLEKSKQTQLHSFLLIELSSYGARAKDAVPLIQKLSDSKSKSMKNVIYWAKQALKEIQGTL